MPEIVALLDALFAERTLAEWGALFDEHGFTWAPAATVSEFAADPQAAAIGLFPEVEHPTAGRFRTVAAPVRVRDADIGPRGAAPDLGQHTAEVLGELGLTEERGAGARRRRDRRPRMTLPDGLVAVVKHDCPTCVLVEPVLRELAAQTRLTVVSQDDPGFPAGVEVLDDRELETSWRLGIETVPTLLRVVDGEEVERLSGLVAGGLGARVRGGRPRRRPARPPAGLRVAQRGVGRRGAARAALRHRRLASRTVELADLEDEVEAAYDRGWTDGLPVVPPTEERVLRMLRGTARAPDEVVAVVPPDLVPCTVEKVAVNAVLAGCLPEHLPVVLAAVEAACTDAFNVHGLLATTYSSVARGRRQRAGRPRGRDGSGVNALGQGNRANATIGRALQLVVRNVGGGRPGEVDRATLGNPGKYTFCFAEREDGSPFTPLAASRGVEGSARDAVRRRGRHPGRRPAQPRPRLARPHVRTRAARPSATPSWRTPSTRCSSSCPSTAGSCARRAGTATRLLAELEPLLELSPGGPAAGRAAASRGHAARARRRPLPKFRPAGCSWRTPAATRACSPPSSPAGPAAPPAAPPYRPQSRSPDGPHPARPHRPSAAPPRGR